MTNIISQFSNKAGLAGFTRTIGIAAFMLPLSSEAIQLQFNDSNTEGFIDTTVSLGGILRAEDPDNNNANVSDLTFDQSGDLVSTPLKVTVEAGYSKNSKGVFVRGSYIYDAKIQDLDTNEFNITSDGQDEIGNKFQLLDAFVYGNFIFDENMLSIRLGNQVLSWGESTYISNSLNSINPVDITKARGAAVELKEVLLPLPIVLASLDFGGQFSVDAYYVSSWKETIIDPVGTFFSAKDVVGEGALPITLIPGVGAYGMVPRGPDVEADDGGEFGFVFRKLMEDWGYMEIALYYMRQHSHAPFLQVTHANAFAPSPPFPAFTPDFSTASYQLSFPEDIDVYGASFNVDLPGKLGLSLGGEVSHRPDIPLSLGAAAFGLFSTAALGTTVEGFSRGDLTQIQTTITYQGGSNNWFNADKITILVEPGLVFADIPTGGTFDAAAFAETDEVSWGYVALVKLEFSDALFNMTLEPSATFRHDVSGTSPGAPIGTFLQDRKSLTLAITATYLTSSTIDLGYTMNSGNDDANFDLDRDFFAFTVKHSF